MHYLKLTLPVMLILLTACASTGTDYSGRSNSYAANAFRPLPEVRDQVVMGAIAQIGIPYKWGGSTRNGFDCSGLVQYVYNQAGLRVPRNSRAQYRAAKSVSWQRAKPGDLLFFRLKSRRVSHVGIYVGDGRFIHAPRTGKNVGWASLNNQYWRKRLVGAGRLISA